MDLQWEQFGVLVAVVAGWSLVIIGTVKTILSRCFKQCDGRICANEAATKNLERSILEMKADLPLNYLRKEDFIRHEVVINAKLDRIGDQISYLRESAKHESKRSTS